MATTSLGSPLVAWARILACLSFTLSVIPVQALAISLGHPLMKTLPLWYHRKCCRIVGFKVEMRGRRSRNHPTLYVANHVSYFDIMVLSSLIRGSFIAKSEISKWPFFGLMAKLQRTIFIERRPRHAAAERDRMAERLRQGDDLILFPEGAAGDGNMLLPFKSALFSVAEIQADHEPLSLQPVSIAYTRLDGLPMGRYLRPFLAWYGDMGLLGHMIRALGLGWVTVVVQFHPTVTIADFASRKALSDHCREVIGRGMAAALSGRRQPRRRPNEMKDAA